jgi:hypothetical protein
MSGGFQSVYWARHNWSSAPIPKSGPSWNELRKTARELEAASRSEVDEVCSLKPSLRAEGDALLKAFPMDAPSRIPAWLSRFEEYRGLVEEKRRRREALQKQEKPDKPT